jgi:WD40 repeat protein
MDQQGPVIIDKHKDKIIWMAISPDGQKLAAIDRGGVLRICNAKAAEELYCLEKEPDGGVRDCACFSPDSRMLAVHQKNDRIYVYDVEAGRRIRDFETKSIVQKDSTQNGKMLKMQWSTDGGYLAGIAGDTAIHVWTMNKSDSSSEVDEMVWKLDVPWPDKSWVTQNALQWAQMGQGSHLRTTLAWKGSEGGVNAYDLDNHKKWRFEAKEDDRVRMNRVNGTDTLSLLPGREVAISADVDGMLRVWWVDL